MNSKIISYSIALAFISFIVGMVVNAGLKKTDFYHQKLSNLNFLRSRRLNRLIGIGVFKWIVRNTPFKFFNQKLKLKMKIEKSDLLKLREEMTSSEVEHLIGFVFVSAFALAKIFQLQVSSAFVIMLVNVVMNLYPSLLQQENKRRIDHFLRRFK
jgi:Glycosyl-4,4'-diaponeurosporenoate acyltransferase